jgi:GTP cyclohydrolase I
MEKKLILSNENTPLSDKEKDKMIDRASKHYGKFLSELGFDWENDPNMADTPRRFAKAFVLDLAAGCFTEAPKITAFDNLNGYDGIVFQGDIEVKSFCSHHNLPFIGKAYVAYIPNKDGKIIGLSKLNRIVEHFARRPQVQENLTMQVHDFVDKTCDGNSGVAVVIKAGHLCACVRGVNHDSTMMTSKLSGAFKESPATRDEFYKFIEYLKK